MAERREDFPDPTVPQTATKRPFTGYTIIKMIQLRIITKNARSMEYLRYDEVDADEYRDRFWLDQWCEHFFLYVTLPATAADATPS